MAAKSFFVRGMGRDCESIAQEWHPGAPRTLPKALLGEGHIHIQSIKYSCTRILWVWGLFPPSFPPGSDFVIGSLYPGWQRAGIREQNNARQGGQRGVAVLSISKNTSSPPDATEPPTRPLPASTSATSPSNCCWEPGGDKEMGDSFSLLVDLGCWHGEMGIGNSPNGLRRVDSPTSQGGEV